MADWKRKAKTAVSAVTRWVAPVVELIGQDTPGLAARTAYYLVLSVLPLFIFVLSLLRGLNLTPDEASLMWLLPASVRVLLEDTLNTSNEFQNVTWIGLCVTVWTGSSAVWALMVGIYHALGEQKGNPPAIGRLLSLLFTAGLALLLALSLGLMVFGRALIAPLLEKLGVGGELFLAWLPRVGVAAGLLLFILLLYRFTPGFNRPVKRLWPGALFATAGWLLVCRGFEFYVTYIARWTMVYGGIGLFLGLTFWLFVIALLILVGARINAKWKSRVDAQEK